MSSLPHREIALRIDGRLEHVALAGGAVRGICAAAGGTEETCAMIELCVVEAVTNTVAHAYHGRPGVVELVVSLDGEWLTAEVRDRGDAMDPALLDEAHLPDALAESGRGLLIVREIADEVKYRSGEAWNALTIRKRLAGSPAVTSG